MNFNELMNDDTCQILLAIIVGIVICYFIFGSGSGSCNRRDGFSVGGDCDTYTRNVITNCANLDVDGNSSITADELDGDIITDPCLQAVMTYQRNAGGDAGDTTCDIRSPDFSVGGGTDQYRQAVIELSNRRDVTPATCEERVGGAAACIGIHAPLRTHCEFDGTVCNTIPISGVAAITDPAAGECNSPLTPTETAYTDPTNGQVLTGAGADILCKTRDSEDNCIRRDPALDYLNCEWTPFVANPSDAGTCNTRTDGIDSICRSIDESDGQAYNREQACTGHSSDCVWIPAVDPTAAGGQSLSVEDIREKNIMDSIKNMILKVAVGNLNQTIPAQLNNIRDTSSRSFNSLFHIGKELNLEFIILVNTDNVASLSKNDFVNLNKHVYILPVDDPITNTQRRIKLGNMFDPYARLSADDKKEIYCSKNTLTTDNEGQEKYDQLLKMRSTDEGADLSSNLSCGGQDGWDSSTNKMYDIAEHPGAGMGLMTEYGDMINNSLQGTTVPADMTTAIDGVLDITSIGAPPRYNDTQMVIIDKFDNSRFPNDRIMKPKYIRIVIKHSIVNIRGDAGATNTIGRGNYQLLFMDGMSSNGTPYNEKIDAFDKSNLYNAYYKNLFFVQYLIFKIFLGTGRYVPRATSFLVTDPGKRNDDIGAREYSNPHPNWYDDTNPDGALNNMCTSSGRDYLVLGLLKEHTHAQSAAESRMNKHTIGQRPLWDPTMPRINSIDRNGSIFTEGATTLSTFDFSPQSQEEYLDQYPVPAPAPTPPPATPPPATPQTRCDSVSYIFDTGQGCEWLDINNGEYDHKNCSEFVARSIGANLGHICVAGGAHGGAGVCQNGPICTAPLPILSGKVNDDL